MRIAHRLRQLLPGGGFAGCAAALALASPSAAAAATGTGTSGSARDRHATPRRSAAGSGRRSLRGPLPPDRPALSDVARLRRTKGFVVLEGFHALKHALRFGAEVLGAWTADAEALEALRSRLAPDVALDVHTVGHDDLAAVVPRAQVVAVARRPAQRAPADLLADPAAGRVVLLEDCRHLGNLGACVRVAAAAGVAAVLTTGQQDPWHADALRGSAGLHFALPVHRLRTLQTGDRPLLALDPAGEPLEPGAVLPARAVLAFGTERDGLSDALLARADARVALPMAPGVSSLNLATAVSAVLFGAGRG
jgi:TrmH family RNA methyltransferase